ncbi:sigma-54 dependent transcriptional regulator [Simiduia sp. 21SJ11W-1]|uniref:sigma-54-dependent transcriptional regulator n=1 Tax=Simiduia sp. 21SJ11W-1 TaxID=2909669 RepID=UPI00209E294D|nr:sigma-54 dependent transcriptional regulator [Simiduia sp. 21SJ11W-1]UTA48507.1 sigma-54 dependent transcriptional regulator [Simiduia sp. 21SJ11W-1]
MQKVLLVDDDQSFTEATQALLENMGHQVDIAHCVADAKAQLERTKYHTLLLDLMLPDGSGFDVLNALPLDRTPARIAFVTGHSAIKSNIKSMAGPGVSYLLKPVTLDQLDELVGNADESQPARRKYTRHFGVLVGESPAMHALYEQIEKVAQTQANVLIQGESGTGKELIANAIHNASNAQGPLVAANCGAISKELIASELFGHEKGAFTGAVSRKPGLFERANHGTLFLDEVTEMPIDQQPNLLRVLETGQVTRLGGTSELSVSCRVVSATNRTHQQLAEGNILREDIYFRLAVFPLQLPPLRERVEDIPLLCQAFLDDFNTEYDTHFELSDAAINTLSSYSWPGNVRELRHALHRAVIMSDKSQSELTLPAQLGSPFGKSVDTTQPSAAGMQPGTTIEDMERQLISMTLESVQGDKPKAAEMLGISLKTLYNRLNQYKDQE